MAPNDAPFPGRVLAVARDPRCLFVCWSMADDEFADTRKRLGLAAADDAPLRLRVVQSGTTVVGERETNGTTHGRLYWPLDGVEGRRLRVELGVQSGGRFHVLERSASVDMPRDRVDQAEGLTWMSVDAAESWESAEAGLGQWEEADSLFDLPEPVPAPWSHEPELAGESLTPLLLQRWPHLDWQAGDDGWRARLDVAGNGRPAEVRVRFAGRRWLFRSPAERRARVVIGPWLIAVGTPTSDDTTSFHELAHWHVHLSWTSGRPSNLAAIYRALFGSEADGMLRDAERADWSLASASSWTPQDAAPAEAGEASPTPVAGGEDSWPFAELVHARGPGGGASEMVAGGASEFGFPMSSEQLFLGGSEQLFVGGSEMLLFGASEQLFAGSSEVLLYGASEQLFLATPFGSTPNAGASEQLFASHAPYEMPGASEQLFYGGATERHWGDVPNEEAGRPAGASHATASDRAAASGRTAVVPSPALPYASAVSERDLVDATTVGERAAQLAAELSSSGASPDVAVRRILEVFGEPPQRAKPSDNESAGARPQANAGDGDQPKREEALSSRRPTSAPKPASPPHAAATAPTPPPTARPADESPGRAGEAAQAVKPKPLAARTVTPSAQVHSPVAATDVARAEEGQAGDFDATRTEADRLSDSPENSESTAQLSPAGLAPSEAAAGGLGIGASVLAVATAPASAAVGILFAVVAVAGTAFLIGRWQADNGRSKGLRMGALFAAAVAVPFVVFLGLLGMALPLALMLVLVFAGAFVALLAPYALGNRDDSANEASRSASRG